MAIASYVASFGLMGLGVRCYQLALQQRNIFSNLGGHALSVGAFSGLGYYLYGLDERQTALLADRRQKLLEKREAAGQ